MEHEHHNNKDLEDMKRKKLFHFTKCRPMFKFRLLVLCSLYIPRLVSETKIRDARGLVRGKRIIMQFMRGASVFKGSSTIQAAREEVDSRSVYVGNVDYSCTAEIVRQHFQECGVVNRVTILTNSSGHPKGCAYVEFMEIDSVNNALLLDESVLHGRILKVCAKRTNIPGVGQFGRRPFGSRAPFNPTPGYGRFRRFRRPTRYRPY